MPINFPEISKAEWLAKFEKDLKGKPLESLNWEVEGEVFSPFWHKEDLLIPPVAIKQNAGWKIGQVFDCDDPVVANKAVLKALNHGVSVIYLYGDPYHGLPEDSLSIVLKGVITDLVEVVLDRGNSFYGENGQEQFFASSLSGKDGEIDSLGWDLFNAYDDFLRSGDYVPTFHLLSDSRYFETIAIFRAMRLCWNLIGESHGKDLNCRLTGHLFYGEVTDDNANMISGTSQAMAAVSGGADTVVINPTDNTYDMAFADRIAVNIHHLLSYESHLDKVADPAAGSYFLEMLTDHYSQAIWSKFQFYVKNPRLGSFQNP